MAKILIVDDSRTSRRILKNLLENEGHEIIGEAGNGEEAIAKYFQLKPEIVTMDITMPVMDGLEALRQIHEGDETAKVIMVTAAGQRNKMIDALRLGASEFVTKPFDKDEILELVTKLS